MPTLNKDEILDAIANMSVLELSELLKEFEEKFAAYIGCPYAVAVNSGTAALHLALDAIGVKTGDSGMYRALTRDSDLLCGSAPPATQVNHGKKHHH